MKLKPQGHNWNAIILSSAMVFSAVLILQSILVLENGSAQNNLTPPTDEGTSGNFSLQGITEGGTYIVTLKNQSSSADLDDIMKSVKEKGANVTHVYSHSLIGFSVQIPPDKKTEIMYSLVSDVRVDSVEPDQTMTLAPPLK